MICRYPPGSGSQLPWTQTKLNLRAYISRQRNEQQEMHTTNTAFWQCYQLTKNWAAASSDTLSGTGSSADSGTRRYCCQVPGGGIGCLQGNW